MISAVVVASSGCFMTCLSVRAVLNILRNILGFQLVSSQSCFLVSVNSWGFGGSSSINSTVLEVSLYVCEFTGSSVAVYDRGVMAISHYEIWNSLHLQAVTILNVRQLLA